MKKITFGLFILIGLSYSTQLYSACDIFSFSSRDGLSLDDPSTAQVILKVLRQKIIGYQEVSEPIKITTQTRSWDSW